MLKSYNISLDLEKKTSPQSFSISQNDLNTIELNIVITKNKAPLNISGAIPRIVIKKPSYLTVIQDCEIVDALTGKIKVVLNTQAYSESGSHSGEVYLYEGANVLVTETFTYSSNKAILNDKAFKSSNEWQSINDAFIQIDGNMAQINDGINRIENADVYTKSEADVKLAEKAKQTDVNNALGLKSDKTYVDGELTKKANATDLTVKADKTYVDTQLSGKATNADLGNLSQLNTTDKSSVVNALKEVKTQANSNASSITGKADKTYVDTQLADKTTQLNNVATYGRKFKPSFGMAPWFITTSTTPHSSVPRSTVDVFLNNYKTYGAEEFPIIVHVYFDGTGMNAVENIDDMEYAYNQALTMGIKTNMIKFHFDFDTALITSNSTTFQTKWKNLLTTWATRFQGKNIPYFTVLNEASIVYADPTYEQFVIDSLAIPKSFGFKSGLSTMNPLESIALSTNIKNNIDGFFLNCYPSVSYNLQNTSVNDCIRGWDNIILAIKQLKADYPTKPIIITETGTQDYYEALSNPGKADWNTKGYTKTNGKASDLFLKGMFQSDLQQYVEKVVYWYYDSLYYDTPKATIKEYLRMGVDK